MVGGDRSVCGVVSCVGRSSGWVVVTFSGGVRER